MSADVIDFQLYRARKTANDALDQKLGLYDFAKLGEPAPVVDPPHFNYLSIMAEGLWHDGA